MHLHSNVFLLIVLLGHCCQPILGIKTNVKFPTVREINVWRSGVEVNMTQLTRRVKLGNPLEIVCRAEQRAGLPVILSWRWIANGVVVDLDPNRLPPGKLQIEGIRV